MYGHACAHPAVFQPSGKAIYAEMDILLRPFPPIQRVFDRALGLAQWICEEMASLLPWDNGDFWDSREPPLTLQMCVPAANIDNEE